MIQKITSDYTLYYPDPLFLKVGEQIKILKEDDGEWKGWFFCEDIQGKNGWISKTYFKKENDIGIIIKDYNAIELTVKKDDEVLVIFEDSGWAWCKDSNNNEGWLPTNVLGET